MNGFPTGNNELGLMNWSFKQWRRRRRRKRTEIYFEFKINDLPFIYGYKQKRIFVGMEHLTETDTYVNSFLEFLHFSSFVHLWPDRQCIYKYISSTPANHMLVFRNGNNCQKKPRWKKTILLRHIITLNQYVNRVIL